MGIARLTHSSKIPPSQKVAILAKYQKQFRDLLATPVDDLYTNLMKIQDKVTTEHKAMAREAFKELGFILNSLASIETLDDDEREDYAEDIARTYSEVLEKISNIVSVIDAAISKHRHKLETNVSRATDKEIDPDLDEEGDISITGVKSMADLKEAFARLEKKQADAEKKAKAKNRKKPVKEEDDTDFESKSLSLLEKYSRKEKEAPRNPLNTDMAGVFEAPIMMQGTFNFGGIAASKMNIQNIGSGFYMFENLPLVYINPDREDAIEHSREVLKKWEEKTGDKYAFPDAEMAFRDRNSPNLEFRVAMPVLLINLLSPFKSIDQAAFPWATRKTTVGAPKHKQGELEKFINEHPRMKEFSELGLKVMRRHRRASEQLEQLKAQEQTNLSKQKNIQSELDAAQNRNDIKKSASLQFDLAKVDNILEDITSQIEIFTERRKRAAAKIKSMRDEKAALTKELRESYVAQIKKPNRKGKRKHPA